MTDVALPIDKDNKRYAREYWRKIEENRRQWTNNPFAKISKNPFLQSRNLEGGRERRVL